MFLSFSIVQSMIKGLRANLSYRRPRKNRFERDAHSIREKLNSSLLEGDETTEEDLQKVRLMAKKETRRSRVILFISLLITLLVLFYVLR